MTPQASETIIIAGKEFKPSNNLLSNYLASHNIQVDDAENCTAVWELKGNSLYLNSLTACANGKPIYLNDLFPDMPLFDNPSSILVWGVAASIEVELGKMESLSDRLVIKLDESHHTVHIVHIQILNDGINYFETEAVVFPQKLYKLIDITQNRDSLEAKIHNAMALGLNSYEILCELHNSITFRILRILKKHPNYYMPLLCYYYPFTREMLEKYQGWLNWNCLSENLFLDWNEELLINFKDKWSWELIGQYIIGIKGLSDPDLLLKYYEMGLIDAYYILLSENFPVYHTFENPDFSCEKVTQLLSRSEKLNKELQEEFKKWNENVIDCNPPRSNTTQNVGYVINEIKSELEEARYINCQNQPKELELEQIISFLEREGKNLDGCYVYRQLNWGKIPDPFMFDNPQENGIDYTFNTPEKRKVLDDAVQLFFEGHPALTQIEEIMNDIKGMKIRRSRDIEGDYRFKQIGKYFTIEE